MGSIPGLERSPGGGNGNPLQNSCLGNPMDRRAWWAAVHGVEKSWTWLSEQVCTQLLRWMEEGWALQWFRFYTWPHCKGYARFRCILLTPLVIWGAPPRHSHINLGFTVSGQERLWISLLWVQFQHNGHKHRTGLLLLLLLLSRFSRVRLCATPSTAAHQAPPSLGFSRQEHWSWLPFPSPMHESEKWK